MNKALVTLVTLHKTNYKYKDSVAVAKCKT